MENENSNFLDKLSGTKLSNTKVVTGNSNKFK